MDVNSPAFLQDPYRVYKTKRAQQPVFRVNEFTWTITGYEPMSKILANPLAGRGNVGIAPQKGGDTSALDAIRKDNLALQILDRWMLFKNPPEHGESRGLVSSVFTSKMVDQMEILMRTTMRSLIKDIHNTQSNTFDLFSTIAYSFPITVICEMIGIPKEDRGQFHKWTQDFSLAVEADFTRLAEDPRARLNQSAHELVAYFEQLIPRKAKEQNDDLMTRLINASDGDISNQELLANCVFLLFAGQETTTCLISNTVNAFLKNPEQLALLRSNPSLVNNAVDECLRYDPPIQMVGRFALGDIELGDLKIRHKDHMYLFLGAAGWDPEVNPNPEIFDIERKNIKHLAFTRGTHHCLGASLAKLEIKVVLEEMINGFSHLEFASPPTRRPTWLIRGFNNMPLRYKI